MNIERMIKDSAFPKEFISTGCKMIDDLIGGGFPIRCVSGIISKPDCGKTQFASQLLHQVERGLLIETEQKPVEWNFLYFEDRFKNGSKIAIIRVLELEKLMELFGLQMELKVSSGGKIKTTIEVIENKAWSLRDYLAELKPQLIVIDSLTMPIKTYLEQKNSNLAPRATIENMLFGRLEVLARDFECAIIITHHQKGKDPSQYARVTHDAYGGEIVKFSTGYLMHMEEMETNTEKAKYGLKQDVSQERDILIYQMLMRRFHKRFMCN